MTFGLDVNDVLHTYDPKTGANTARQYGIRGKEAIRIEGNILYHSTDMKTWHLIEMADLFTMVREHIAKKGEHEKSL